MKPISFRRFCEEVLHLELSQAWRVLLMVAIDGVQPCRLEGEQRELARLLFGDVDEISPEMRRVHVWRLGRGSGKTTIAAALGVWLMVTADLGSVGPGMIAAVVVVAPTKPTAKLSVGVARELVRRTRPLEQLVCDDGDTSDGFSLRRPDGRRVSFVAVAASRGGTTLRGFDLVALILDEAEFMQSNSESASLDGFAVSDRDLFSAARPRLHGPAIFISTPWPAETLTDELFSKNHGHPTTALAAIGTSVQMRPNDARLARDVAAALAAGDDDARREFLCETTARGGSRLFDLESIEAAIVEGRPLAIQAPAGASVAAGGDLGLERDSSALVVVSSLDGAQELVEFEEIRPSKGNPLAPGFVIKAQFAPILHRHNVDGVMLDAHYRQSAIEHLTAAGLSFYDAPTGAQGKYDSYMNCRALLRTQKLKLPRWPRLIAQLRDVTAVPLPGGGTKISSPRRMGSGGHGDLVSALVLASWSATTRETEFPDYITAAKVWREICTGKTAPTEPQRPSEARAGWGRL